MGSLNINAFSNSLKGVESWESNLQISSAPQKKDVGKTGALENRKIELVDEASVDKAASREARTTLFNAVKNTVGNSSEEVKFVATVRQQLGIDEGSQSKDDTAFKAIEARSIVNLTRAQSKNVEKALDCALTVVTLPSAAKSALKSAILAQADHPDVVAFLDKYGGETDLFGNPAGGRDLRTLQRVCSLAVALGKGDPVGLAYLKGFAGGLRCTEGPLAPLEERVKERAESRAKFDLHQQKLIDLQQKNRAGIGDVLPPAAKTLTTIRTDLGLDGAQKQGDDDREKQLKHDKRGTQRMSRSVLGRKEFGTGNLTERDLFILGSERSREKGKPEKTQSKAPNPQGKVDNPQSKDEPSKVPPTLDQEIEKVKADLNGRLQRNKISKVEDQLQSENVQNDKANQISGKTTVCVGAKKLICQNNSGKNNNCLFFSTLHQTTGGKPVTHFDALKFRQELANYAKGILDNSPKGLVKDGDNFYLSTDPKHEKSMRMAVLEHRSGTVLMDGERMDMTQGAFIASFLRRPVTVYTNGGDGGLVANRFDVDLKTGEQIKSDKPEDEIKLYFTGTHFLAVDSVEENPDFKPVEIKYTELENRFPKEYKENQKLKNDFIRILTNSFSVRKKGKIDDQEWAKLVADIVGNYFAANGGNDPKPNLEKAFTTFKAIHDKGGSIGEGSPGIDGCKDCSDVTKKLVDDMIKAAKAALLENVNLQIYVTD